MHVRDRIQMRVKPEDYELFRQVAKESDMTLTAFLVQSGREHAERMLADRRKFEISSVDWDQFTDALDRPAEANPAMVGLFSRPKVR